MLSWGVFNNFERIDMENVLRSLQKDQICPLLNERIRDLSCAIKQMEDLLKNVPSDYLRVSPHNGSFQYYHVTKESGKKGNFIPKRDWDIAKRIAQRDYDSSLLKKLCDQLKVLQVCAAGYHPEVAESCWSRQHPGRRKITQSRLISDDEFAEEWQDVEYHGRSFEKDGLVLNSAKGERVRSKSEVIIANTLFHFKVPYRYEFPHRLKVSSCFRDSPSKKKTFIITPDFTCLNKKKRKEYIWEHFGLIDDPVYVSNMALKLEEFQKNGFFPGENFIMTFETSKRPLDYETVEILVRKYLM